jgi:hypothetical protein
LKVRPAAATVVENRRASSFFDLDLSDLRNLDAGELWRGVIQSQTVQGGKADIRGGYGLLFCFAFFKSFECFLIYLFYPSFLP